MNLYGLASIFVMGGLSPPERYSRMLFSLCRFPAGIARSLSDRHLPKPIIIPFKGKERL